MNKIFLIFLFSISFVFASCGEDVDCSTQNTDYLKYGLDEETKECVVVKEVEMDVCGNGVIEEGETFCSCEDDVVSEKHPELGCFGDVGEYLERACNNRDECGLYQNEKVVKQTKSLEFGNSDLTIEGNFELNNPYIINSDNDNKIEINMNLFKTSSSYNIKNIVVNELKIENSRSTQLAKVEYEESLVNVGDNTQTKIARFSDTTKYEISDVIRLKLVVSYTKETLDSKTGEVIRTENRKDTFTESLGRWTIINPIFFEK